MNYIKYFLYFLFVFALQACDTSDSNSADDFIHDGPVEFNISGDIQDNISPDRFDIRAEWIPLQNENLNEVIAKFFSSKRDTVDQIDSWQRYHLSFVRNKEWPQPGDYGIFTYPEDIERLLPEYRQSESDQFFVNFSSIYRENTLDTNGEIEAMFLEDTVFLATAGNIEIITSSNEYVRGKFDLEFARFEKRSWDGNEEIVYGPAHNALSLNGSFTLNLVDDRVDQISMVKSYQ